MSFSGESASSRGNQDWDAFEMVMREVEAEATNADNAAYSNALAVEIAPKVEQIIERQRQVRTRSSSCEQPKKTIQRRDLQPHSQIRLTCKERLTGETYQEKLEILSEPFMDNVNGTPGTCVEVLRMGHEDEDLGEPEIGIVPLSIFGLEPQADGSFADVKAEIL